MSTSPTPPDDSTPADPRPVRRTLNLYVTPDSPLDRVITLSGERDLARTLTSMIDRYLSILHRASPRFSDRELCAIIDALGDSWDPTPGNVWNLPREIMTAITADRLDAKWELDADTLRPRLDRMAYPERVSLAEMTIGYWQLASPASFPQDTIDRLKQLIQSPDSRPSETQRPRRVSPDAFDRGTAARAGEPIPHLPESPGPDIPPHTDDHTGPAADQDSDHSTPDDGDVDTGEDTPSDSRQNHTSPGPAASARTDDIPGQPDANFADSADNTSPQDSLL